MFQVAKKELVYNILPLYLSKALTLRVKKLLQNAC